MKAKDMMIEGKLLSFLTSDGVRLNGFLFSGGSKRACIINVHGMTGNFYGIRQMLLAQMLGKRGVSFFSINTRGHDAVSNYRIEDGRKSTRVRAGTNFERFEDCVFDIKAAIGVAERMGFRKIMLCGHSTGCQKIAYYQYKSKDRRVSSLILLGPADDYSIAKRDLGRNFGRVAALSRKMVSRGRGDELDRRIPSGFSAQRFDSTVNQRRIESRIFNYDGKLREFASIRIPILAIFGSKEEFAAKSVGTYLKILGRRTRSANYRPQIIRGADHSFKGHELELAQRIAEWAKQV
ncbi:MAG: alpha/beta fold hydrolase [Candidatus Micrarchaeota archaeon]|nr:alpha/beta fold hydrolase [Candidatus Micrarchaeota archaeon]MDE1824289.1 alpha/beta fold hydrolase [Candidatus Micrarchaeota archaeon]MDE1849764.1 alpha/beta fold hydrolase [Candidatus Micrarchaeota archaeon]